jgi:transposase-like protein
MVAVNRNEPVRAQSSESRMSLMEFMREFPDDATCLDYLWRERFSPDGEHALCPKCNQVRVFKKYPMANRRTSWTCTGCGQHVHPTAGTIFHKSPTSLHLWFYAMYLMSSTRCGISAKQLERELGVTYKCAWRMANLIRNKLMHDAEHDGNEPLQGTVEADETFIGGDAKNKAYDKATRTEKMARKAIVLGAVERGGKVRPMVIPFSGAGDIRPRIQATVKDGSNLYTDGFHVYRTMQTYNHGFVDHNAGVYVAGDVHTNTIEGFWSLMKRGIDGVYHNVSHKWLQSYCDEYAFRYNHRKGVDPFRVLLARVVASAT